MSTGPRWSEIVFRSAHVSLTCSSPVSGLIMSASH